MNIPFPSEVLKTTLGNLSGIFESIRTVPGRTNFEWCATI